MSTGPSAFISYSKYDREAAFTIRQLLEAHGVEVWLDMISIKVSSQLLQELYDNIDRHETFCLLLSPTSLASPWVLKEIEHAKTVSNLRFVPVILRSCKIPSDLENVVALDARQGLEHDSVRSRLVRAVCGDGIIEDAILFSQLQIDLLADKQLVDEAELQLPDVQNQIQNIENDPIREVRLYLDPETLPEDGKFLELRLELGIWKGTLSFCIARYREQGTWPSLMGFDELPYTDFYRQLYPPFDVRFRWLDYKEKMPRIVSSDYELAQYKLVLDGREFKPGGNGLSMPTALELPSLSEIDQRSSSIQLFLYDSTGNEQKLIDEDTDIQIELFGIVDLHSVRLYRSAHTYRERVLISCPAIVAQSNSIRREVLIHRLAPDESLSKTVLSAQKLSQHLHDLLDHPKTDWGNHPFVSDSEKLRVTRILHQRAGVDHSIFNKYSDGFKRYLQAIKLYKSLQEKGHLSMQDIFAFVDCWEKMIESCFIFNEIVTAQRAMRGLQASLATAIRSNDEEDDYYRLNADARLLNAEILIKLDLISDALQDLRVAVDLYHALYRRLPSYSRRLAYVEALQRAIERGKLAKPESDQQICHWTEVMEREIETDLSSQTLASADKSLLPSWLKSVTLAMWPTIPIENATLRYFCACLNAGFQVPLSVVHRCRLSIFIGGMRHRMLNGFA